MNPREQGFLLLSSHLGNPDRKPLTTAQLRTLAQRIRQMPPPDEDRPLEERDLRKLGYGEELARRIVALLEEEELLAYHLRQGEKNGCVPVARVSPEYPRLLHSRLGTDSPACFWAKGDLSLLEKPGISLVGSRELQDANREFAREVGFQAAAKGLNLISGNARGADRTAQEAALEAGGSVISIVADSLADLRPRDRVLYLSEDDFDAAFSAQRALSRNRCIHAMGQLTFVAQADLGKGGTWDGTVKNLRHGWSNVAVFRDGSDTARELEQLGAYLIGTEEIKDCAGFTGNQLKLWD